MKHIVSVFVVRCTGTRCTRHSSTLSRSLLTLSCHLVTVIPDTDVEYNGHGSFMLTLMLLWYYANPLGELELMERIVQPQMGYIGVFKSLPLS